MRITREYTREHRNSVIWPTIREPYGPGCWSIFVKAYMNLHKESGIGFLESLINGFEPVMTELGIGTIPEIFDGDPPHRARGAISQAWSVAALLRIIERYEKMTMQK